jgi:CubicO group peptidase (beta-lactamase class C family)
MLASALAVLLLAGCPQSVEESKYQKAIAALEDYIKAELGRGLVNGVSVALVDDQEIVWAQGFGYADKAAQVPATKDTVYRVGSISKLFTDIGIMQQVEQGKLDIDADITNYIPEFHIGRPAGMEKPTTLRQLMCHLSGFPRESPVGNYFDDTFPSIKETVESIYNTSLIYPPEENMKYSNIGITLVGYVLERVSGEPFVDYEKKHLLEPIGMTGSNFLVDSAIEKNLSKGYMWVSDGREIEAPQFELAMVPAGNLYSTAEDMARFLKCLFAWGKAGENQVVKKETLEKMFERQFPREDDRYFGLGFAIGDYRGHRSVNHSGAVYGFTCNVTDLPDEKIGVVVLTNEDIAMGPLMRIRNKALDLMLEAKLGEAPVEEPKFVKVDGAVLDDYVGEYESPRYWAEVKRAGDGIALVLSGQPLELFPLSETEFAVEGKVLTGGRLTFTTGEGGKATGFIFGADEFMRVDPSAEPVVPAGWEKLVGKYGQEFIPFIVSIKHGHLYAFVENEFDYRLTPVSDTVFNLPQGMYEGQQVEFKLDAQGKVEKVVMAYVEFKPIPGE